MCAESQYSVNKKKIKKGLEHAYDVYKKFMINNSLEEMDHSVR